MDVIGVFTHEQARELWQDYQSRKQLKPQLRQNFPERRPIDDPSPHRVFIQNRSDETIPPFGCVQITGVELYAERTVVTVTKPTATAGEFLFNGPYSIEPHVAADPEAPEPPMPVSGVGWAYRYGVVIMLGDEPSEANVAYQPIIDSWEIEEGPGPFVVFGRHDVNERALIGRFSDSFNLIPGIVTAKRDCNPGYYTVQLAEWSGTWVNFDPEDPDPCPTYTVTDSGTTSCAIEVNEPSLQVTGRVDESEQPITVLAYDCQSTVISLKLNKMVWLKNLGNTVTIGEGEEAVITPVWQIVRGRLNEEVYYEDTYDCCDGEGESGTETLISRIPSIVCAIRLPQIDCGTCTP